MATPNLKLKYLITAILSQKMWVNTKRLVVTTALDTY
jgi:hypothetical protein